MRGVLIGQEYVALIPTGNITDELIHESVSQLRIGQSVFTTDIYILIKALRHYSSTSSASTGLTMHNHQKVGLTFS